ncbi:MAG: sulfate ABC transporter substrate-binding protein [Deltaproteobacteria bacterium]|nr:MAG: sulfate ABC transporter substrate-binding protein [Deltaproteobacteria bacterium]
MKRMIVFLLAMVVLATTANAEPVRLAIHSCCVTEDATTREILPAFKKYYKEKFGKEVEISASFAGSGTLKNQILGGAPVQVAIFSSELYLDQLKDKGLISSDWRKNPNKGSVIKSVIVFVTRKDNPKGLRTYQDLARPGIKVLHASPDTSGGAQWAIFAIYGAGADLSNLTFTPEDGGVKLLSAVGKNVIAQPESARQTFVQFDAGFGDAIVTYENEALLEKAKGRDYAVSVPRKTIETEWKVARIDRNIRPAQEHAVTEFIKFLYTAEAQRAYAKYGFRPVDARVEKEFHAKYAKVADPFTVDDLGGWQKARKNVIENAWKKTQQK